MRCFALFMLAALTSSAATPVGIFEDHADIGAVLHPGSAQFDKAKGAYTLSGSGENMWSTADEYHYVWKKVSGDASLAADIAFTTEGGDPHRKAMLVMRQSLDPASAYVDAAFHGNGLTSLQWRETAGAATHEIQSNVSAPKRVRIEKQGEHFYLFVSTDAGPSFSGAKMRVPLTDPFYIGIGVCAHHKDSIESAMFSNVALNKAEGPASSFVGRVTLETITVSSTDRRVVYVADPGREIISPTWTSDGKSLLFLSNDTLRQVSIDGGTPLAADASLRPPPDSKNVIPDIVTQDGLSNMFPHPSPDGTRVAFLSEPPLTGRVNPVRVREMTLRVMLLSDKSVRTLAKFYAAGSSFNLSPWSPDSKKLAFVSH